MRLICFGDSWTAGHGIETDVKFKEIANPDIFTQKLRNMNSWPRWVAEKMGCAYVNMGMCGYGNEYILRDIIDTKNNGFFEKDDIVIVMLSYPYRYKKDTYNVLEIFKMMEDTLSEYTHFYFNSFYPTFKNEDIDTSTLPNYFINTNDCVSDVLKKYEIENDVSVWEYGSRRVWNDEKNYWEGDYHPNLNGYKIIGEHVYNQILNYVG